MYICVYIYIPYKLSAKTCAIKPLFTCLHFRKTQRFDSTKFSQRTLFGKFGAIQPGLFVVRIRKAYPRNLMLSSRGLQSWKTQRFDSTKSSERKPRRKFGAIEPPFVVLIFGKRGGSIAPIFLKKPLWKTRCYPTAPIAVFRFGKRSGSMTQRCAKGITKFCYVLVSRHN